MSDNMDVTPGTGRTIAADDVGGILYQRVKLGIGVDGTATDLAPGQAAMVASLPVVIASNQSAVPVTVPVGQQNKAASTPVVIASDQGSLAVTVPVGQAVMASSTPVVIASNQSAVSVTSTSSSYDVSLTVTRPANTTAYTANSVVGAALAALNFATVGPSASPVMITGSQLEIDIAAVPSGMTSFRLYLYNVTPPSALADGAAWDLTSTDRSVFLGYIDLGTPVDLGSTLYVEVNNINKQLRLSSANLYGYLVTNGGYTPGSGDVFKITLHTVSV